MSSRSADLAQAADQAINAQLQAARLKANGSLKWLADDRTCPDVMRLAALTEELGEVARDVHDGKNPSTELAQLAGVALAWLAYLNGHP